MRRLLLVALLLGGCAQKEVTRPAPVSTHTTVWRFTSLTCDTPEAESAQLKAMTKSRDDWKRYAERLEKLPDAKPAP